ncbi:MAG: alkaline phosphatase family protein, partial [bacterium]
MTKKLMVIGLDAAPPVLVFDNFRSDMPFLSRIMEEGAYCELESCIPPITSPAWMCMMTGKDPGTLGVYGFRNRKDYSYNNLEIATSVSIKEPTVWDMLSAAGKKVILIGVPQTYPPKRVNGLLVSCFLAPDTNSDYTYPTELKEEIKQVVGNYILDVNGFRAEDKNSIIRQVYEMTEKRFQLARHLINEKEWDFFMTVEMGPDRLHHALWKFSDPCHPKFHPETPYKDSLRDYYSFLDEKIAELCVDAGDETAVMVVSDHGAKRMEGGFCINEWLIREGYLKLNSKPDGIVKLQNTAVDWERTVAWGEGGYYGRIFLNIRGREPRGFIERADYEKTRGEIAGKLEALSDDNEKFHGTSVYRPEDIYRTVNGIAPDLIVLFGDLFWRSVGTIGHGKILTRENDTGPDDANHDRQGIFIMKDMSLKKRGRIERMNIIDCAPVIL